MQNTMNTLPPEWAPDTDVASVVAEMEKRVNRLIEMDKGKGRPSNDQWRERCFLHGLLAQLIKTGHS